MSKLFYDENGFILKNSFAPTQTMLYQDIVEIQEYAFGRVQIIGKEKSITLYSFLYDQNSFRRHILSCDLRLNPERRNETYIYESFGKKRFLLVTIFIIWIAFNQETRSQIDELITPSILLIIALWFSANSRHFLSYSKTHFTLETNPKRYSFKELMSYDKTWYGVNKLKFSDGSTIHFYRWKYRKNELAGLERSCKV